MKYLISNSYKRKNEFFLAEFSDLEYLKYLESQDLKFKIIDKNTYRFIKKIANTHEEYSRRCKIGIERKVHKILL